MSKTTEILKALGFLGAGYAAGKVSKSSGGNDEISKIINSYDHDLTSAELEMIKEGLSEPEILHAFKKFISNDDVNENLKAQAEKKLENIERQNPDIGSYLKGLPLFIFHIRRKTEFYQFIVDHSDTEIINIASEVKKSLMNDEITPSKYSALQKKLGISDMTRGEDGAYGVWKYLNRKKSTQIERNFSDLLKERQK